MPYSSQGQWISGEDGGGTVTPDKYKQVGMNLVYDAPGTQFDGQKVPNNLNMKMTKDGSWMPIVPSAAWDGQGISPTSFDATFGGLDQSGNLKAGATPNIQDYIDLYNYNYAKHYGDLPNRPWNYDSAISGDATNQILNPYNAAAAKAGLAPMTLSQLPVSEYASSLPAEQKGSSSMLGGALHDPAVGMLAGFAGGTLLGGLGATADGFGAADAGSALTGGSDILREAGTNIWGMGPTAGSPLAEFGLPSGTLGSTAVGGAAGGLLSGLSNVPTPPIGVGSGAAPIQEGPTTSGAGPGGSVSPLSAAGAGGTALSRLLNGSATPSDYASLLGTLGATGLGVYSANKQADSLSALADRNFAIGAPSRDRYEGSYAPGFTMANDPGYADSLDQAMQSYLRKASTGGNALSNPGVSAEALKYVTAGTAYPALQNYRNQNAATGGYNAFNTAAPGSAQTAVGAQSGALTNLAGGISDILNPQPKSQFNLSDFINQLKLNTGSGLV